MPIYEENTIRRWRAVIFMCLAFLAIYLPVQLGNRELRWKEGYFGAMVREMKICCPNTVAHGELIAFEYPLYPWTVSLLEQGLNLFGLDVPVQFSLRLVSVMVVGILTILLWIAGTRAVDLQGGVIAAAVMMSSMLVIEKALDGYPDMLAVLFIFCAWLAWFTYGVARNQWNRAWLASFFFCGLGFYTIGWPAFFYFIIPLFFMRRPMTVWPKLRRPGLLGGLLIFALFIMLWGFPRWLIGSDVFFRELSFDSGVFSGYLMHLLAFPFTVFLRFLPWSALAWPAFCPAYEPLDRNPIFGRFMKTIFVSLLIFFWISPYTDTRNLLLLVPPLALLTGQHYWLLVRRHGFALHQFFKVFSFALAVCAFFVILFYLIPPRYWHDLPISLSRGLEFRDSFRWPGIILATVAFCLAVYACVRCSRGLVWAHGLLICVGLALCYWALFDPYRSQDREKALLAAEIRASLYNQLRLSPGSRLPRDLVIYKGPRTGGLYGELSYLNTRVQRLHDYRDLPADQDHVFVLARDFPLAPAWSWEEPLFRTQYNGRRLYLCKGTRLPARESGL